MIRSGLGALISNDRPGHWLLSVNLLLILLFLLTAPFLADYGGTVGKTIFMLIAVKIAVYILLSASYDLLVGYTAILSLAHTLFFSIGAYAVGFFLAFGEGSLLLYVIGIVAAILLAAAVSIIIGLIGLRIKGVFFIMLTYAIAVGALSIVVGFARYTGGLDGLALDHLLPQFLHHKTRLASGAEYRLFAYYFIVVSCILLFLFLLRLVNSPFGSVLKAIRENEFRAGSIGYNIKYYKVAAFVISGVLAAVAGVFYASWIKTAVPNTFLNFDIMLTILIIVMIGGKGTLYGAVIGTVIMVLLESRLNVCLEVLFNSDFPEAMQKLLTDPFSILGRYNEYLPIRRLFSNNRWSLYIGIFYIVSVYFFSNGIVGRMRSGKDGYFNIFSIRFFFRVLITDDGWRKTARLCSRVIFVVVLFSALGQILTGFFTVLEGSFFEDNGVQLFLSGIVLYVLGCSPLFSFICSRFFKSGTDAWLKYIRVAQAIAAFVVLMTYAVIPESWFLGRLQSYNIDSERITVSGLSSGGYMAGQFHVANSDIVSGAGIIAAGPYYCTRGILGNASGKCSSASTVLTDEYLHDIYRDAKQFQQQGKIPPLKNLERSRVYIFSGANDPTVKPEVVVRVNDWYLLAGVTSENIHYEYNEEAGHTFATESYGNRCEVDTEPPWISSCGYNTAKEMFVFFDGTTKKHIKAIGNLKEFNQAEFFGDEKLNGFEERGYVYIPESCNNGAKCGIHIFFHGCQQGFNAVPVDRSNDNPVYDNPPYVKIGTTLVENLGFNEIADVNDLIILYPQVKRSMKPYNPRGCYDFWGYAGGKDSNFATKYGIQVSIVRRMVNRLMREE